MGVLINSTESKKIKVAGTDIELQSAYSRLSFKSHPNGRTIEIFFDIYSSKEKYLSGEKIFTDIPDGCRIVEIDLITEVQSIEVAHTYAIQYFESLGYQCQYL